MTLARGVGAALALCCWAGSAFAWELSGRIELSSEGRPLRATEASDVVVYFLPGEPAATTPMAEQQVMSTRRKQFSPRVLAITPGTLVRFPNEDPILHNAFSTSPGNDFDTGIYGRGEGVGHRFETPGHVRVYCNVHHTMIGHILVLDTPHIVRPDARGGFRLTDLPEGGGQLLVWHERAATWQMDLDGPVAETVTVTMDLSRRRVPNHRNKFGRPYDRRSDAY